YNRRSYQATTPCFSAAMMRKPNGKSATGCVHGSAGTRQTSLTSATSAPRAAWKCFSHSGCGYGARWARDTSTFAWSAAIERRQEEGFRERRRALSPPLARAGAARSMKESSAARLGLARIGAAGWGGSRLRGTLGGRPREGYRSLGNELEI